VCTIIVLNQVSKSWPVVLASNRDELFQRPSRPPRLWPGEPALVAPVDLAKGGTWMGLAPNGFFVAVTNQRTWGQSREDLESRGELVVSLLRSGSKPAARALLAGVDARNYNPFNLLFGDAGGLVVGYGRSDRRPIEIAEVPAGVHVLPNDELDSPRIPKVQTIKDRLEDCHSLDGVALRRRLQAVLADTELADPNRIERPPASSPITLELAHRLSSVAIETDLYGTRSSAIVALEPGRCAELWYAAGPPQATEFRDLGPLIARL
jgi:uncharacterized protein with NRDE domain